MSHRADMMKLMRLVKKKGCSVERTGSGHWKITTPSGTPVFASFSPSNPGAYHDAIKKLQKAGVKL